MVIYMKKISEIKEELQAAKDDMLLVFMKEYEQMKRSEYRHLLQRHTSEWKRIEHEIARTEQMKKYEKGICFLWIHLWH